MKDVISIHLGQAGVQLGTSVWELFGHEHNLDANGELQVPEDSGQPSVEDTVLSFYKQLPASQSYAPRAILVDLESTVIDNISRTKYSKLFQSDFVVKGIEDAANNFARGYHTVGRQQLGLIYEVIRKQAECSGRVTGFMGFHSMGGGTGSALGTWVAHHLASNFPKTPFVQVAIFPSPKTATAVVEPYNTVLATHLSMGSSKCVVYVDNEAIYNVCHEMCDVDAPNSKMMNDVISQAVSSITTGLRFECHQTADFNDFHTNLIPYPRLHFPIMSLSPVIGRKSDDNHTINDVTSKAFQPSSRLAHFVGQGAHIACCLLYRGDVTPKDVNETIANVKTKKIDLVPWIPTGFKIGISPKHPQAVFNDELIKVKRSVCLMSNNTGLRSSWKSFLHKYQTMLSKGAFLHWYLCEGMEFNDFMSALEDMKVLLDDYQAIVKD